MFITSESFISVLVLPHVIATTFFFQFTSLLPYFLRGDGGKTFFLEKFSSERCFFCVCFDLTSLHSSENILHSSHTGCFLLTHFLLLLHLLSLLCRAYVTGLVSFKDVPKQEREGSLFHDASHLRFTLLTFLSSFLGKCPWVLTSLGQQHFHVCFSRYSLS